MYNKFKLSRIAKGIANINIVTEIDDVIIYIARLDYRRYSNWTLNQDKRREHSLSDLKLTASSNLLHGFSPLRKFYYIPGQRSSALNAPPLHFAKPNTPPFRVLSHRVLYYAILSSCSSSPSVANLCQCDMSRAEGKPPREKYARRYREVAQLGTSVPAVMFS